MLALIFSDGRFDLPEHLLIDLTDSGSESSHRLRSAEIKDAQEVFMLEVILRVKTAASHEGVGDADRSGIFEYHFDVVIIIFLQKGILNDVENIPFVILPVFCGKSVCDPFKLISETIFSRYIKSLFQSCGNSILVFTSIAPEPHGNSIFFSSGIGNIKDIAQSRTVAAGINQGDSLGAATHIPFHVLVPEVILGTGSSVRTLCVDHQLFVIRVLVEPCGCFKKSRPALIASCNLL